jgi:hypothetical protein
MYRVAIAPVGLKLWDPDEYFFKAYEIKSVYSVTCAYIFKLLALLVKEGNKFKVSAGLFENKLSKDCSESRIKFLFWLSISLIGRFCLVCIHGRLS